MSFSDSNSESFSSSEAIIAHFDEAAGVLVEGGFTVSAHAWRSITQALSEKTISRITFWGLRDDQGSALLELVIDWSKHELVVGRGDSVRLPMLKGEKHLYQVRRAAESFLRAYCDRGLSSAMRLHYAPEHVHRAAELNERYGWVFASQVQRNTVGDGWGTESRYHEGVTIEAWFGD